MRPDKTKESSSFYSSNTHSNTQTTHAAGSPTTVGTPFTYPRVTLLPVPHHYSSLKRHEAPPVVPHHHHHHHHHSTAGADEHRSLRALPSEPAQYAEPYMGNNYSPPSAGRHSYGLSRSSSLLLKGSQSHSPPDARMSSASPPSCLSHGCRPRLT